MPSAEAQARVWVIKALAKALRLEVDSLHVQQYVRDLPSLSAAGAAVGLSFETATENGVPRATLGTAESGWAPSVVLEQRGDEWLVERPGEGARWTHQREFSQDGAAPTQWVTAVPSAPLHALSHHQSPGQRLWALLRLERDDLVAIVAYASVVGLLTLATPLAVQALVSSVAFGTLLQPIVVLSTLLLAALGFQAVIRALQTQVVELIQERLFIRTSMDLAWRLPRVKRAAAEHSTGLSAETVNRFFDVVTLQKTSSFLLTDGIATVLQVAIGVLVLAFYHPALLGFAAVLVVLIVLVIVTPWRMGLLTSIEESKAKYGIAAWLQTLASSTALFRGSESAQFAIDRADALTRRYLDSRRRHFRILFGQTIGGLALQVFASAALLGLGGWLVLQRELTLGQLIAAELIVTSVTSGLAKSGKLLDSAYDLLTSLDKIGHMLDLPIEDESRVEAIPFEGPLRVEVQQAADEGHSPLSFDVAPGARLAIVGAEGHPLAEWLASLRVPASGSVSLNGVETSRARESEVCEQISLIQRRDIFEGSVLENVTAGRQSISTLEARAALETVGLLTTLRALPDGLDTRLQAHGFPLSQPNIVQLLVARAIVGRPCLIVINKSLESLDSETRARCVAALTNPAASWTLICLVADAAVALRTACNDVRQLGELASSKELS